MSEPCPNCGSAKWPDGDHFVYDCGGPESVACSLIRSLREDLAEVSLDRDSRVSVTKASEWYERAKTAEAELAEARDAERDQIADHLELRASKLEDELAISETSSEVGLERMLAVIKSLRREAQAIRSNEHRSNT